MNILFSFRYISLRLITSVIIKSVPYMRIFFENPLPTFLFIYLLFSLLSCNKHSNNGTSQNGETVKTSIYGIVKDESGIPVVAAVVKCGAYTTQSDQQGLFFFKGIEANAHTAVIVVRKIGYFNGSRTMTVHANDKHTVTITMLAKGTPRRLMPYSKYRFPGRS